MEYTIQSLAKLSGVSTRTLRYYDEIGLLRPVRKASNGYRIYGQLEVDRLQQLLLYRSMGMKLEVIARILDDPEYDAVSAMEEHLCELKAQQERLESIIDYVDNTISYLKGEREMSDKEKFEIYKDNMIRQNEEKFGAEAREKYGDDAVDFSNMKIKGATREELEKMEKLTRELNETLRVACEESDPSGETAQKACALHKKWISFFWKSYSKEAHLGLCRMYLEDERFYAYYEKIAPKCADFLYEAMKSYLNG